jgi:phage terminase large subunit-like protein
MEPQAGPQTDFITSEAEIRIYAGAMGTGKTYALLLDWLIRGACVDHSVGLICRQNSSDITIGGGLWDEAKKVFADSGEVMREGSSMDARWPATESVLSFRHLKEQSVTRKKGPGFTWIGIEEATECSMTAILWLLQRMRSVHGTRPMMAMTTNPDPFHPLRKWVDWYTLDTGDGSAPLDPRKSGVVRYTMAHTTTGARIFADTREECAELAEGESGAAMTYTVISSVLSDNKILEAADPSYRNKFAQMMPAERAKNLDADWNAKKDLRGLLRGLLDRVVDKPIGTIVARARGWDMAGTEPHQDNPAPDFTAGCEVSQDNLGNRYFSGLAVCRKEPPGVLALMRSTATLDGPLVTQAVYKDPAQAGKGYAIFVEEHLRKSSRCGPVLILPCGSKKDQKVLNASPVAEDISQGKMYILAGPWLEAAYDDGGTAPDTILGLVRWMLGSFPSEEPSDKDDICDGLSAARVALEQVHIVRGSPRETAREAQKLAGQNRLRPRGRGGYGGRR